MVDFSFVIAVSGLSGNFTTLLEKLNEIIVECNRLEKELTVSKKECSVLRTWKEDLIPWIICTNLNVQVADLHGWFQIDGHWVENSIFYILLQTQRRFINTDLVTRMNHKFIGIIVSIIFSKSRKKLILLRVLWLFRQILKQLRIQVRNKGGFGRWSWERNLLLRKFRYF